MQAKHTFLFIINSFHNKSYLINAVNKDPPKQAGTRYNNAGWAALKKNITPTVTPNPAA
jgi:hypothetical protein